MQLKAVLNYVKLAPARNNEQGIFAHHCEVKILQTGHSTLIIHYSILFASSSFLIRYIIRTSQEFRLPRGF